MNRIPTCRTVLILMLSVVFLGSPGGTRGAETNHVLKLGGTNGCLEIQPGAFANLAEATMEGWVKWNDDATAWGRFFDFGRVYGSLNVGRVQSTTHLNIERQSGLDQRRFTHVVARGAFKTNEWMHLAAVISRREMRLYLNGFLVAASTNSLAFNEASSSERNFLGRNVWFDSPDQNLPDVAAEMDEFRVWDSARSVEQVREGMFQSMHGDESGLVCLLNFEGGQPIDRSPRRLQITMHGNARVVPATLPSNASELPKLGVVRIKVIDKDGNGIDGAVLKVVNAGDEIFSMRTGPGGEAEIGAAIRTTGELRARDKTRTGNSRTITVIPGETIEETIQMHPPQTIGGAVTDFKKSPLAGINVELRRRASASLVERTFQTVTDQRGGYSFEDLAPGDYEARVQGPKGPISYNNGEILRLAGDLKLTDINFSIPPPKRADWKEFDSSSGLPSDSEIRKIVFEKNGTIWFATQGGLARFDGADYEVFTSEHGLPDDVIMNLALDTKGNLWVSTMTGIARYDGKTLKGWTKKDGVPGLQIDGILADRDGTVWFSSGPEHIFNFDGEKFKYFSKTNGLPHRIFKMAQDKAGNIWMCGTDQSLVRFDGSTFTKFTDPRITRFTDTPSVHADGSVWFGANGVFRFDGKEFKHYSEAEGLTIPAVVSTYCAPDGKVWVAGRGGAAYFDGTKFVNVNVNVNRDGIPARRQCISVTGAPDGAIWFGTYLMGALRYDPQPEIENFTLAHGLVDERILFGGKLKDGKLWFSSPPIAGIEDSTIWDGTEFLPMSDFTGVKGWKGLCAETTSGFVIPTRSGVTIKNGDEVRRYSQADGLPDSPFYLAAAEAKDGSIWITSMNGVGRFKDGKWTTENQSTGYPLGGALRVLADKLGRVWFQPNRNNGVAVWENETWKHLSTTNGLPSNSVNSFFEDTDGSIWIATDAGLCHFKDGRFKTIGRKEGLPHQTALTVFRDSKGVFWAGTPSGVGRFDGKLWSTLRAADGLSADSVGGIVEDNEGGIWFLTQAGLSRYQPQTKAVPIPDINVALDRVFTRNETLPQILKGRLMRFKAVVGDIKARADNRRFLWAAAPGKLNAAEMLQRASEWSLGSGANYEWAAQSKGAYTVAARYVDRGLNYSEPSVVHFNVVPPWYLNAFIAVPTGGAAVGLLGWAFIARYLYMQKRREAERLREEMLRKEQQARATLEQKNQQLEKAMEAAESANRTKSQFLATMSHELRTPLNAILGYSEMLEEELQDRKETDLVPDLQKIQGAGKHLLGLINDILDLSKIEAGKMTLYTESFDIAKIVRDIANTVEPLVKRNGNELTVDITPGMGTMHSDLTKVRQTLFNLLSNAAKFTEKGTIRLEVSETDGSIVQFKISDTGIGMTPEQLSKLFQAFTQADASTSRKYGGTGLGLVLSRNFCTLLGGDIEVRSELGKGSIFVVRLPRRIQSPGAGAEPAPAPLTKNGRGHVLVIDDDPNVRELMNRHLTKEGYAVSMAASGEQGLALARQRKPDIITVDIIMPGQDGWSVLSALKADAQLNEIPVVLVSMVDEKQLGFSLGAADYMVKPIDWERLSQTLQRYRPELPTNEILVVEDDLVMRDMLSRQLEKQSWVVHTAENGRVALESLAVRTPGLILLDLMMPEMDGFAFLEELRQNKAWQQIPVIVVTAKDLSTEELNQLEGQIRRVVQKSARSIDELLGELREISKSPRTT